MLEDEHLISGLRHGDKQALCQIYLKYKDNLLTIAASLLYDVGSTEDILHIKGRMEFRCIACMQGIGICSVQNRYRYGIDKPRIILNGWPKK
jgi:hypothetical protein